MRLLLTTAPASTLRVIAVIELQQEHGKAHEILECTIIFAGLSVEFIQVGRTWSRWAWMQCLTHLFFFLTYPWNAQKLSQNKICLN